MSSFILTLSSKVATPVKTGCPVFCNMLKFLDSGFNRNDDSWAFLTFDESINLDKQELPETLSAEKPIIHYNIRGREYYQQKEATHA